MKLAIIADDLLKKELLMGTSLQEVEITWLNSITDLKTQSESDTVIHLMFEGEETELSLLHEFLPRPVIINSVIKTLHEINHPFIRINAWPTFLKREITEAACNNEARKISGEKVLNTLGKKAEWVPDIAGFISPRVIAMIINEAYFALEENVSTKEEIDTAMKLGTNYPFGPFEWAGKIGLKNIADLLSNLSLKEKRYQPATLLMKEAGI